MFPSDYSDSDLDDDKTVHYGSFPDTPSSDSLDNETEIHKVMRTFQNVKGSMVLVRVKKLLKSDPECAKLKNKADELPIHHAKYCREPNTEFIESIKCLLQAYPESLSSRTSKGDLPLHNEWACIHLSSYLIKEYPQWIKIMDKRDRLPLHYAVMTRNKTIVDQCITAFPDGLKQKTVQHYLPIHFATTYFDKEVLDLCMKKYPEGLRQKTYDGNLPIHYAIEHGYSVLKESFSEMIDTYPESAKQKNHDGDLPLHLILRQEQYRLSDIKKLLKIYREGIHVENNTSKLPGDSSSSDEVLLLLGRKKSKLYALNHTSNMHHPIMKYLEKIPSFAKKRLDIIHLMLRYTHDIQRDGTQLAQEAYESEIKAITNCLEDEKKSLEVDLQNSSVKITKLVLSEEDKCSQFQKKVEECSELEKNLETIKKQKEQDIIEIKKSLLSEEKKNSDLQKKLHLIQKERDEVTLAMKDHMKVAQRLESIFVSKVIEKCNDWTLNDLKQFLFGLNLRLTSLKPKQERSDFHALVESKLKLDEHGIEQLHRDFLRNAISRIYEELHDFKNKSDGLKISTTNNSLPKIATSNMGQEISIHRKKIKDQDDESEGRDGSSRKRLRVSISP